MAAKKKKPVKAKKKGATKAAKTARKAVRYTTKQKEEFFVYWVEVRSFVEVAKRFKVARNTIISISKKEDWKNRFQKVIVDIRKKSDKAASSMLSKNVQTANDILQKITDELMKKDHNLDATPGDWVKVAKYVDEQTGDTPVTPERELIIHVVDRIVSGPEADRSRVARNFLAGLGINDAAAAGRMAKVFSGKLHTQN